MLRKWVMDATTRYTMSSNSHWLNDQPPADDSSASREQDNNNNNGADDEDPTSAMLLPDLHGKSDILSQMHIGELSTYMPARAEGYAWTLAFTTTTMGFSLKSLYRSLSRYEGPVLLIIRDSEQRIFGAFCSCTLNPSDSFYGTGETYLFTFKPIAQSGSESASSLSKDIATALATQAAAAAAKEPERASASSAANLQAAQSAGETAESISSGSEQHAAKCNQKATNNKQEQFLRFPWTGDNLYFIKGNADSLAFGAGEGKYGLWLDEDLFHGSTHSCKTFNNEPLTNHEDFVVCTLECWYFL